MDVSGVVIGPAVRLLVPEDGSPAILFHPLDDDWCATSIDRAELTGSFGAGDLTSSGVVACEHLVGRIEDGQWTAAKRKASTNG